MSELSKNLGIPSSKTYRGDEYLIYDGFRSKSDADDTVNWLTAKNGAVVSGGAIKRGIQFKARAYRTPSKAYPYAVYYCPMKGWSKR